MIWHVFKNAERVGEAAAAFVSAQILKKPDTVLGLATGSSPLPLYGELIRMYERGLIDFSKVCSYNLDEYIGLGALHPCSYRAFMQENLFNHINIKPENTNLPDGSCSDPQEECVRYDDAILKSGGIDLQILGIGANGHIGFNEPNERFTYETHVAMLSQTTLHDNRKFFPSGIEQPARAITMGIGGIMAAECIVLIATGRGKAEAIEKSVRGPIVPSLPASVLRLHSNVIFLLDEAAADKL